MTESERPNGTGAWAALFLLLLFIWAALTIQGCTPKIIERMTVQRDTTVIHSVQVDSVFRRDSIFVREKGDTIFIYREHVRDRYKFVHDTLRLVEVDSVAVDRIKEVKVEKSLSAGQSLKIRAFWWLLFAAAVLAVWAFRKPILKLIKRLVL